MPDAGLFNQKIGTIQIPIFDNSSTADGNYLIDYFVGNIIFRMYTGSISAGSSVSAKHSLSDTVITVPTDKKWIVVVTSVSAAGSRTGFEVYASNTQNTADGTLLEDIARTVSANNALTSSILEVPTGKYLTIKNTDSSDPISILAWIIEVTV